MGEAQGNGMTTDHPGNPWPLFCPDCGDDHGEIPDSKLCRCGSTRAPVAKLAAVDGVSVLAAEGTSHDPYSDASLRSVGIDRSYTFSRSPGALDRANHVFPRGGAVVQLLDREFQAALVSICACAFSIDALYGALIEKMPVSPAVQRTWVNKGTPRYGRIAVGTKAAPDMDRVRSREAAIPNLLGGDGPKHLPSRHARA